jgi:hypothetical protein
MKKQALVLTVFLLLILVGCSDNPTQPFESLTHEINSARPFKQIEIDKSNNIISYGPKDFKKAYAKNGIFIVALPFNKHKYYNLSTIKEVYTNPSHKKITIIY